MFLRKLANEIHLLVKGGRQVALVTSGAVAAGVSVLGIPKPRDIPTKQAAAAVGQSRLMHAYEETFQPLGMRVAQVLVTHDDLANRKRFLNARNTLMALFSLNVLPVFNENDTVVVDEIKVGDNDNLSALVAPLIEADLLIILSDISGLFSADPRKDTTAKRIGQVDKIDSSIERLAGGAGSDAGTGGMLTKIEAAKKASAVGIPTIIADGRELDVLSRILAGEDIGTLFTAAADRLASRKHWIAFTLKPQGKLHLDAGATRAVREGGKSLLPSGVLSVEGRFGRGDPISIFDAAGLEIARGLSEYADDEIKLIAGKQSTEIEAILGFKYTDVIVHRDDLVLLV